MRSILEDAIEHMHQSKLPDGGKADKKDLTGHYVRNIVNNICSNNAVSYLEIGLYRGGIFSAALHENSIYAVGVDNWSQNWTGASSRDVFFDRINPLMGNNDVSVIEADCWSDGLLDNMCFNTYMFDGPHGYQDQYDALTRFVDKMEDEFIYMVDDYDKNQSPEVVEAVQESIKDLDLDIVFEYYAPKGDGFHQGVYFSCLRKNNGCINSADR